MFDLLPVEIWQYILFKSGILKSVDVQSARIASKYLFEIISPRDPYMRSYWRSLSGMKKCLAADDRLAIMLVYNRTRKDLNLRTKRRAFYWGCNHDMRDMVRDILKDPDIKPEAYKQKAFIEACENGSHKVVKLLLSHQSIDPCFDRQRGLFRSTKLGQSAVVKVLLNDGRLDCTLNDHIAFKNACLGGHYAVYKLIVNWYTLHNIHLPVDMGDNWCIRRCSKSPEITRDLLTYPQVDPSVKGSEALDEACNGGYLDTVKVLCDDGRVNVNTIHHSFPIICRAYGSDVLDYLLTLDNIEVSINDNSLLLEACYKADINLVRRLVEEFGVDPSYPPGKALYSAIKGAKDGAEEVIRYLLYSSSFPKENQIDPSCDKNKALRLACTWASLDIIKLLLGDCRVYPGDYVAPKDCENKRWRWSTPTDALFNACDKGRIDVVELLVSDPRVDVHAHESAGLRIASVKGHAEIVSILLARGADPSLGDNHAITVAVENGHLEVIEVLFTDKRVILKDNILENYDKYKYMNNNKYPYRERLVQGWAEKHRKKVVETVRKCRQLYRGWDMYLV